MRKLLLTAFAALMSVAIVRAQGEDFTCRAELLNYLALMEELCEDLGRDAVCTNVPEAISTFEEIVVDNLTTAGIDSIDLPRFNPANGSYGAVVFRPRANMVEGALTAVAFGDVNIENLGTSNVDFTGLEVEIGRDGAIVRAIPGLNGRRLGFLTWGDRAYIDGRTSDGQWLRIQFGDQTGWIGSSTPDGDIPTEVLLRLPPDPATDTAVYGPMQAMRVEMAIGNAGCGDALESGILFQTPSNMQDDYALININDGLIRFNGTILVRTDQPPDGVLNVEVLEGDILLGESDIAFELGKRGQMRPDENGDMTLVYLLPLDYAWVRVVSSPLNLLPRPIEPPFNTFGLLEEFEPGTGFLTSMLVSEPCRVVWTVSVNLRAGPGTNYPVQAGVLENFAAFADARAMDDQDGMWWRLADGVWVAAENTVWGGNCATLPFVEAPTIPGASQP